MNRRHLIVLTFPFWAAALLQAQINAPKTGTVRYPDGAVHAVYGLPANYIVDGQVLASADAVSFSDSAGLTAKNGRILLVDSAFKTIAEYDSAEAAPVLNVDGALTSAVAWLPAERSVLYWSGSSLVMTAVSGSDALGIVTSIWRDGDKSARLLASNAGGSVLEAKIALDSGVVTSLQAVPGVREAAFHQQSFFVFPDEKLLAIASSTAVLRTFPLPATGLIFERMSSNALHVISPSTNQNWVLHLGANVTPQLSQLPASPGAVVSSSLTSQEVQR